MAGSLTSLSDFSTELADLVDRASRAVVSVDARPYRPASGLIVGPELVVTADHVIERDEELGVTLGDRRLAAVLAGRDPATDTAVLRVAGLGGVAPPRAPDPRVGQLVVSISRTRAGAVAAGLGVVAAIGGPLRTGAGATLRQVIRTDAASRRGTSGGAIVDASGGVIAMTTAGLVRGDAIGIPIGQLMEIATVLAANKGLRRAYLGVSVQPVRFPRVGSDGVKGGLLVSGLAPGAAADMAGILIGDVILAFNGTPVAHASDLQDALAASGEGSRATIDVSRGGTVQHVQVTAGARPSA
jgi:S1-C subfamily serine protease